MIDELTFPYPDVGADPYPLDGDPYPLDGADEYDGYSEVPATSESPHCKKFLPSRSVTSTQMVFGVSALFLDRVASSVISLASIKSLVVSTATRVSSTASVFGSVGAAKVWARMKLATARTTNVVFITKISLEAQTN